MSSVAFSPDGQTIVSGSGDHTIKLWNLERGEEIYTLRGHQAWVSSVAFSPDGQTVVSGSGDHTIKLWDVATGNWLATFDNRPYFGLNITGVKGLSEPQIATLKALGAVAHS